MIFRAINAAIHDALHGDVCLMPLLDVELPTSHGSVDYCDQPPTSEAGRPLRRVEQGWPSDFQRAVVTWGNFASGPLGADQPQEMQILTFQVGIFVIKTVADDAGDESAGDLYAHDIREHVIRILALQEDELLAACAGNGEMRLMQTRHAGDILPVSFNTDISVWQATTQFAWIVLGPGVRAPAARCRPC
jgi:hypothetical protein